MTDPVEKLFTVRSAMGGGGGGAHTVGESRDEYEELFSLCNFTSKIQLFIHCRTKQQAENNQRGSAVCSCSARTLRIKVTVQHLWKHNNVFVSE